MAGIRQFQVEHSDFRIGLEFRCGGKRWRCTDLGTRTIIAICLEHEDDPSWYSGPPYAIVEHVFDEDGIGGCEVGPIIPEDDGELMRKREAMLERLKNNPAKVFFPVHIDREVFDWLGKFGDRYSATINRLLRSAMEPAAE